MAPYFMGSMLCDCYPNISLNNHSNCIIISIIQIRRLRPREVERLASGCVFGDPGMKAQSLILFGVASLLDNSLTGSVFLC